MAWARSPKRKDITFSTRDPSLIMMENALVPAVQARDGYTILRGITYHLGIVEKTSKVGALRSGSDVIQINTGGWWSINDDKGSRYKDDPEVLCLDKSTLKHFLYKKLS